MTCHGSESWHPDPEFYYEIGGGPMLDMGPYYLTALISLLGPIDRVTGSARITFPRKDHHQPTQVRQEDPSGRHHPHCRVMDFASGAIGTIITSFDVWSADLPPDRGLRQ